MTNKNKMILMEEVKVRTCTNCEDKKDMVVNINGKVTMMPNPLNPCMNCAVKKLEKLLEADR